MKEASCGPVLDLQPELTTQVGELFGFDVIFPVDVRQTNQHRLAPGTQAGRPAYYLA